MTDDQNRLRLAQALANIDTLPAMPAIAQKLMALKLDSAEGEAQLLILIEQDPQISAKLISLANAPIMGIARKVCTVREAAILLGMTRIKSVSLGIAAMSNLPKFADTQYFSPRDFWLHSLSIAVAMHTLSLAMPKQRRPQYDQIYLAGLLHDMGYMAIHHLDSTASNELHRQLRLQPKRPVIETELQVLGVSHCYAGAQLARQWNLPYEIITVMESHHAPRADQESAENPLVRMLNLAEKLLPNFGITEYCGTEISDDEWQEVGIDPGKADELCDSVNEIAIQITQTADLF